MEALLENRIGIRGWLPIRPIMGNHILASLTDEQQTIGGLEIGIRFCKTDDYLKVINAGKDVGWLRTNEAQQKISNNSKHLPISYDLSPSIIGTYERIEMK